MKVNLHTHSVKSDGVFTPEEVVKIQRDDGIEAMSLTDHDNVSGTVSYTHLTLPTIA